MRRKQVFCTVEYNGQRYNVKCRRGSTVEELVRRVGAPEIVVVRRTDCGLLVGRADKVADGGRYRIEKKSR